MLPLFKFIYSLGFVAACFSACNLCGIIAVAHKRAMSMGNKSYISITNDSTMPSPTSVLCGTCNIQVPQQRSVRWGFTDDRLFALRLKCQI